MEDVFSDDTGPRGKKISILENTSTTEAMLMFQNFQGTCIQILFIFTCNESFNSFKLNTNLIG